MATLDLTKDNFEQTILGHDLVIIDFWAPWCGPCQGFAPVYEEISEKFPNLVFAKVNTEAEQELAGYFQIRSIPTLNGVPRKNYYFFSAGCRAGRRARRNYQ